MDVPAVQVCVECEQTTAFCACDACGDLFCSACWQKIHLKGPKQLHTWQYAIQPEGIQPDMPFQQPSTTQVAVASQAKGTLKDGDDPKSKAKAKPVQPAKPAAAMSSWGQEQQQAAAAAAAQHAAVNPQEEERKMDVSAIGKYVRRQSITGHLPKSLAEKTHLESDAEARARAAGQMGVDQRALNALEQSREQYIVEKVAVQGESAPGLSKRDGRRASIVLGQAGMVPGQGLPTQ